MSSVLADPRDEARILVQRYLFRTFAALGGVAALLVASNAALAPAWRWGLSLAFALAGVYGAVALHRPAWGGDRGIAALCLSGILLIGGSALANGAGINLPAIGFFAVFTFLIGATVTLRQGLGVALGSVAVLALLAWSEHEGWIAGASALAELSVARRLVNQLVLLVVGLVGGLVVAKLFRHYLGATRERELRFQALLGIAADLYWEMDPGYRVTTVWRPQADGRFVPVARPGLPPWEAPGLRMDACTLATHRADLEARRPFRNLPVHWDLPEGPRHELVSGEPRFAGDGSFLGYWGVTRDVSDNVAAADALRRSEAMLSHLVTTSPDLITLTDMDSGRYVMVNDAFVRYSGYSAAEAIGRTSLELGVWGDAAHRDEFVRRLREDGAVKDLPIEFRSRDDHRFVLLVSAARFEMEGGNYIVLNGRDVSAAERTRLAHEAVLANASLGIAFTRERVFVQANPALERMLGWPIGTLTGQPGRAVWASDAEYAEVGALIGPALARGESVEFVRELARRDGATTFWCRLLAKAVDPAHPMGGGTIWIIEDITERRRTEQALAKARDDAEAASEAKSAFLANTSHEIRTPLNGLVGLARLARRPDLDEERRRRYLDQIADSAEALSAVISDVLDLSKIEAGKLDIESVAFDLHELLGSLAQVYRTLADARGLAFTLEIAPGVPVWVQGDPVRLRQILGNYLNNALKFTPHGEVGLRVAPHTGDRLRFEVHDSGLGIAPDVQARLFHPFMQADQSTTRRYGGSGLGLSICRELATLMQGHVGVDSAPGAGSRFWAELPLPAAAIPAEPSGFGVFDGGPLRGARVLMAEDNPVNMTIAVAMLEQWGIEVAQAVDGAQAVAAVEQAAAAGQPFDAVLMDVQMPVMSGYEATRRLRAGAAGARLPIIALTAAALTSEREQALDSGMSGFLTKPIDARRLHDALVAALAA
ncbi:MAG: PAS domain S-box protein [Piscinibacter sp.]|nr:PAS domain S-box protein [Piscinibacter sp.]